MHISEGVMSGPVLAAGAVLAAGGLYVGLKRLDPSQLPKTALMAAVFFLGSLIHVPIGPVSAHLVLGGLVGVLLGFAAFPAIFTALALQAVLFQYGGLLVLGLNTFNMALPAVLCSVLFGRLVASKSRTLTLAGGFGAGFCGVLVSAFLTAVSLSLSGEAFLSSAQALFFSHIPVMFAEGAITALTVGFVSKVRPAMLLDERVQAARVRAGGGA